MTKQDAIELLTDLIGYTESESDYDGAIQMAIKALEYQKEPKKAENGSIDSEMPEIKTDRTTGGMIYRQDAIDLVKDVCEAILSMCGSHYDGEDEVYDDLLEVDAILKCNKEIRIALRNLPPAQPSDDYYRGWHDGQEALREEIWEDGRDRLD